jgi:hypothetical protein
MSQGEHVVYSENFESPIGSSYPHWTATGYAYRGNGMEGSGVQPVSNVAAPNGERFLGEFGGPRIVSGPPFVSITDGVLLTLDALPPHTSVTLAFDLLVLKSWDGNSPQYGPDRFRLQVIGGPTLLDTSFSNNQKTAKEGSFQDYPHAGSPPQTGAVAVNRLGYQFFGDTIYQLRYTFPHTAETLAIAFSSDMYEGKGTEDESWGIDNVLVTVGP